MNISPFAITKITYSAFDNKSLNLRLIQVNQINNNYSLNLIKNNSTNMTEMNLISIPNSWVGGIFTAVGLYILSVILTLLVLFCHRKTVSKTKRNNLIYFLIALSIGTLIGDSVIHLLPECYGLEREKQEEIKSEKKIKPNKDLVAFFIILGFMVIYIFEKLLLFCGIGHSHGVEEHDHSHVLEKSILIEKSKNDEIMKSVSDVNQADNVNVLEKCGERFYENKDKAENKIKMREMQNKLTNSDKDFQTENNFNQLESEKNQNDNGLKVDGFNRIQANNTEKDIDDKEKNLAATKKSCCDFLTLKGTKSVGILIVFSEIIHNIIDGIAIGVVFSSKKPSTIVSTVIAIILHEIPKELADAGVLIHSNFGFWAILFWNSMSNIGGIFGSIIGLGLSEINELSKSYLLSFTAGNFLYISLSQLIPILVHVKGKCINFMIFVGILIGIGTMYLLLILE